MHLHSSFGILYLTLKFDNFQERFYMYKINLKYKVDLVEDEKYFSTFIDDLNELSNDSCLINESLAVDFEISFNDKIIYTLDDNFEEDSKITNIILDKSIKTVQNSIMFNKSKDVSRVDDIGIDDY